MDDDRRCGVRSDRRRRPNRRHRRLRQGIADPMSVSSASNPTTRPAMRESIAAGGPVTLDHVGIFADGVAVKRVGDETFRLCQGIRRRDRDRGHGPDLRRHPGHLRGHPLDRRTGRRSRRRWPEKIRREEPHHGTGPSSPSTAARTSISTGCGTSRNARRSASSRKC